MTATATTAQAATTAGVTVATIRTWCRKGVIAATKTGGRWVITTTSLARRIAIGQYRKHSPAQALHLQPGAARYEQYRGQWTVRMKGRVLRSAVQAARRSNGSVRVLVTKGNGTTKEQTLTGRYWKTMSCNTGPADSTYNAELPVGERELHDHGADECAECGDLTDYLVRRADSSGIVLPICHHCARRPWYSRSYA
jgi:hypothetical protein